MWNSCTSVLPNTCAWEQQDWNKTIKDKREEGKKKRMNVERSTVGTVNLYIKSHLISSSHISHSRPSRCPDSYSFFLKSLSIYTCPGKAHTCCIFMLFSFQFIPYLQRWRVNYLLASKLMWNILSIIRIFITFFLNSPRFLIRDIVLYNII